MADAAGMGSTPLVSILIPAYNAGEWIGETIRSALAQTWPCTEIIVVDDGSTDETLAIARRFESADVKVVPTRHAGAAAARNTALSLSQESLEDSPRTRSACRTYLNNWYLHFLPDRHGLVPQLEQLAVELGGALEEPTLSWKYDWLRRLWGWPAARRAQLLLPRIRWMGTNQWDKLLSRLARRASR